MLARHESGVGLDELAVAFDVDGFLSIDHDLGDGRIVEVHLDGPEPENVVPDLRGQRSSLLGRQLDGFLGHGRVELGRNELL